MKAIFYIDGFNLYKSRLQRQRQYRWLNIHGLAEALAPAGATIEKVNFYTAYVSGRIDQDAVQKQQVYMAALRTLPTVDIHSGNFNIGDRWVKLVHPPDARPNGYVWNAPTLNLYMLQSPKKKAATLNWAYTWCGMPSRATLMWLLLLRTIPTWWSLFTSSPRSLASKWWWSHLSGSAIAISRYQRLLYRPLQPTWLISMTVTLPGRSFQTGCRNATVKVSS